MEEWWAKQPAEALDTIERVAATMGIPVNLMGKNYEALNLLRTMTAGISLTNWLAPLFRRKLKHKVLQSHLQLLQSMILIIYILTPFTMTHSIHLFQGFRIIQTRMMVLTILHGLRPNLQLKSILEGCTDLQHLWGTTLHSHNLFSRIFPASERLHQVYPHPKHATQVLPWLCNASHPWSRIQQISQILPTHPREIGPSRTGLALLAWTWQFVYLGSDPHLYRQSGLPQPWSSPHPRMAAPIELPLHLPILPSKERPSQKTPPQHQRTIWPCHSLASCQTQIHSTIGSPSLDVFTVSKPSRTLDHRPCLRFKYQGEIRTNQDASIQWWRSSSVLCPSSASQQHSGTFSDTVPDRHRCNDQMVAWKTCPQGISFKSTLVPFSKSSITVEEISPSMAFPDVGPPGTLPYSFLQNSLHQAFGRPWHPLQSQTGHWRLVDVQSSNMLLQILVRLQNCCTQSFRSSLGIIRFSSPLAAPTGTCRDCRRLFIEQSLPVQEGILQSDATGHQDLDKKEWPTLHATGQHFGFVPPPLVRTYPTGHQSHYKILHQPTSIHIRRSHFPLRGQTRLVTPHILPMSLLPIHWEYLSRPVHLWTTPWWTILHCDIVGRITPSTAWKSLSLGSRPRPTTSSWIHPGQTKERLSERSTHYLIRGISLSTDAQHPCSAHLSTHPVCLSRSLCHRGCVHIVVYPARSTCRCWPHFGQPGSGRFLHQHWSREIYPIMVHAPGLPSTKDECLRWWSFLCLPREIQQSRWHYQRTHLSSSQCHSEDRHQTCSRFDQICIRHANLCPWQTMCPSTSRESHGQPSLTSTMPNGRFHQWADLVQHLSPPHVKPPFVHSAHPVCWQSSDLRWQTPHRTGTLWSSSRRWLLWKTHHSRDWTGPGISGVYDRNQAFGVDLSRSNQYLSSSLTLFRFSSCCSSEWLSLTLSHCHQGCVSSLSCSTRFDPVNSFVFPRWVSRGGTPDNFRPTLDSASELPIAM